MNAVKNLIHTYITYIKANRYSVFFIIAIAVLLTLSIAIIAIIVSSNTAKNSSGSSTRTTVPSGQGVSQISSAPNISGASNPISSISITTPNPTEAAAINNQTQPQITPNVAVPYTVSNITKYGDNWGVMVINNPDVGDAFVVVKKVNNSWKVVMGPGTYFPQDQLQSIGAPQALINNYTATAPAPSISPSPTPVPGDLQ